jgi:DNA-binding response OmpR family regulator
MRRRGLKMARRILLIEDGPEEQQQLDEALRRLGYEVSIMADADHAMQTVEQWAQQFHLVIIEEAMRGHAGIQLLREARQQQHDLPVVMVTRDGGWDGYASALSAGAKNYLTHPFNTFELLSTVRAALVEPP